MGYLRNKRTGEVVFVPDAPARPPADPTFPLKGPQAMADLQGKQAGNVKTAVDTEGSRLDNIRTTEDITDARRKRVQNPLAVRDQALINTMRLGQGDLAGVLRDITGAAAAVDRFKPAPGKGTSYSWAVPEDNDWPVTAWAKNTIADIAGIPQESREAYQTLTGLQNQNVLNAQIAQKGPQTESDAIRMKLAGVSPNKDVLPNAQLLAEQNYDTRMKLERPAFYAYWANQLGSTHALNGQQKSADAVWNEQYQRGLTQMRSDTRYRTGKSQKRGMFGSKPATGGNASPGWGAMEVRD